MTVIGPHSASNAFDLYLPSGATGTFTYYAEDASYSSLHGGAGTLALNFEDVGRSGTSISVNLNGLNVSNTINQSDGTPSFSATGRASRTSISLAPATTIS